MSLLLGLLLSAAPATDVVPRGPMIVVAAPRHPTVTNMQGAYRPDDPQLVGRIVALDGTAASFDGDYVACARTTHSTARVPAGQLMRRLYPDRLSYGKRHVTTPADFGMRMASSAPVAAITFHCLAPQGSHGADWDGATLFAIGDGRWALSLIRDNLLILAAPNGPIRASFDCAGVHTATEQTICSDRLLAGWDRSVAAAYAQGNGDRADQRAWLQERDKCGTDKACLHDSLSLRTSNLLH